MEWLYVNRLYVLLLLLCAAGVARVAVRWRRRSHAQRRSDLRRLAGVVLGTAVCLSMGARMDGGYTDGWPRLALAAYFAPIAVGMVWMMVSLVVLFAAERPRPADADAPTPRGP